MRDQKIKAQIEKNYEMIPTLCAPTHTLIQSNHPPPIQSPHRYSIFIVLGDSEGIPFANRTKIPQQYAALVSIVYVSRGLVYLRLLAVA